MKRSDIATMMAEIADEIGCDFEFHHFKEGQNPSLPFLVFDYPSSDNVMADNSTYTEVENLDIYLCSETVDFESEEIIKEILAKYDLAYESFRQYIKEENMFQTSFNTEVVING